ncbi:hypothetical protein MNBD_GAMMA24-1786 [hydrothermal vent metagenome]|uniref:Death on curing protein, Doc toxin n=1 Tax=hydrothermal vent metagenome TaxID=652676 RepID=A0A3B1B3E8_9ZZZZ
MAKITWTSEAERWLKDIYDYIARNNPLAAANVVDEIYDKAQILLEQPEMGYKYEHESEEDIRILLYGHYRITYLISQEKDIVILGVFHGALQIENYLFT